jgi:hypothetical protein
MLPNTRCPPAVFTELMKEFLPPLSELREDAHRLVLIHLITKPLAGGLLAFCGQ